MHLFPAQAAGAENKARQKSERFRNPESAGGFSFAADLPGISLCPMSAGARALGPSDPESSPTERLSNEKKNQIMKHIKVFAPGTVANLGVGGSAAVHWLDRVKHIAAYDPKYVVMWLGSNDIAANVDENLIIQRLATILSGIREALPNAKIVILDEFYQPGGGRETEAYRARIRSLNARFVTEFSAQYAICDVFDVVLKDGAVDASMFVDVYHLKADKYAPIKDRLLATIASLT